MTFPRGMVCLALVGCGLAAVDAVAQTARLPAPGLRATGAIYGGYDWPLFATNALAAFQPTGQAFGGGDVNLSYNRPGRRVTIATTATAANRYYPDFTPSTAPSYGASLSLASVSRGRWRWSLVQFAQYAPLSAASFFAGPTAANATAFNSLGTTALASSPNFQISTIRQVDVVSSALLSYSITRRTQASIEGTVGTQVQLNSTVPRGERYDGRLRLSRSITRGLGVYAGYNSFALRVPAQGAIPGSTGRIGGFELGFDFSDSRGFRLSRDTTIGMQVGLATVPSIGRSEFQAIGSATLDHRVSRSWAVQLVATRDARFVQAYRSAVVLSGVSALIGGQIASRLGTSASANYSSGRINVAPTPQEFDSASGTVQMRYDIKRMAGVFIEYNLFRSTFGDSGALSGYPTGTFGRHGVRAGLSLGVSPFSRRP